VSAGGTDEVVRNPAAWRQGGMRASRLSTLSLMLLAALLPSCAVRDEFPMMDPQTGRQVTCRSGPYWYDEGLPQVRIALQCIHACERYGFLVVPPTRYREPPLPQAPDADVKPHIPKECLP